MGCGELAGAVANAWSNVEQQEEEESDCKCAAPGVGRSVAPEARKDEQKRASTPEEETANAEACGESD